MRGLKHRKKMYAKKLGCGFLAVACGLMLSVNSSAQVQPQAVKLQRLDSLLQARYRPEAPGAVVLVAKDFKPQLLKAYGQANLEHAVANTVQTRFPIGSMSKQFAAVAVLKLAESGKLKLTDPAAQYLPSLAAWLQDVTVEQLLQHTSGLISFTEVRGFEERFRSPMAFEDLVTLVRDSALLFRPGTNWSYSNTGYLLAARIVEQVSGQSYQQFVRQNLLEPAGMSETTFGSHEQLILHRAYGYVRTDSLNAFPAPWFDWTWTLGAGDLVSTAGDLMKWYQALESGKIISAASLKKAWSAARLSDGREVNYGLGWVVTRVGGFTVVGHGGALPGFLSDALYVPERKLLLVLLSNSSAPPVSELTEKALLRLMDIPKPRYARLSAEELRPYEGVYERHQKAGRLVSNYGRTKEYRYFTVSGDTLRVQPSGGVVSPLQPAGRDTFFKPDGDIRYIFLRKPNGTIYAVRVEDYPVHYGLPDIGLRTDLPLPQQRTSQRLAAESLKQYVGTYELQKGFNLMVFARGDSLFLQATGQAPFQLHQESDHRFFIREVDAQAQFVADADGVFRTLLFTQGQQYRCPRISDDVAVLQRQEIPVTYSMVQDYLGTYQLQKGFDLRIFWDEGKLWLQATGQQRNELFAQSPTRFFLKVVDATVEFHRNAQGKVTRLTLSQGRDFDCPKID